MSLHSQYHLPEFILDELNNDSSVSENDLKVFDNIYLKSAQFEYPSANTESNWQKVTAKISADAVKPELQFVRNNSPLSYLKWAVATMIIISCTFAIFQYNIATSKTKTISEKTDGSLRKVTLADGSTVTLNTFSGFTAENFNADERIIRLYGEAYFEVVHNGKPFIVKTDAGNIKVLGTTFNIKNRKNSDFQIALTSGKVSFSTEKIIYILKPGEILTMDKNNNLHKTSINNTTLGWLEDKLVFENETLSTIITALENQYNVKLEYDQKLKSEKLTLTFNKLNANQAAELLSKTLNSKVVIK